jgi:hypothetical protein
MFPGPLLPALFCALRTQPRANGARARANQGPKPSLRRGPREGWNPRASIRPPLRPDPKPRGANRTGFPLIATGFRLSRTVELSVRSAEPMNGCARRTVRLPVPRKTYGGRLNARAFRFARLPVRTSGTWERMDECPEPMRANRRRLLGSAERPSISREGAARQPRPRHGSSSGPRSARKGRPEPGPGPPAPTRRDRAAAPTGTTA